MFGFAGLLLVLMGLPMALIGPATLLLVGESGTAAWFGYDYVIPLWMWASMIVVALPSVVIGFGVTRGRWIEAAIAIALAWAGIGLIALFDGGEGTLLALGVILALLLARGRRQRDRTGRFAIAIP